MIEKPKIGFYLDQLIERPEYSEQLSMIATAIPQMFEYIQTASAKHKLVIRRQRCICSQTSELVRYTDQLYLEWRYQGSPVLIRALILLLELVERLNSLLPATCDKVNLPKVLLHRARRRHRDCRGRLQVSLAAQGVSAELIGLVLLPLDQLMKSERMPYKRYAYTMQHIQLFSTLNLAGESPERVDDILCQKLIGINYNNLQFIDLCISGFKLSLCNMPDPRARRRFIRMQKKNLLGLETEMNLFYDSRFVAARTALMRWLLEEQKALKKEDLLRG